LSRIAIICILAIVAAATPTDAPGASQTHNPSNAGAWLRLPHHANLIAYQDAAEVESFGVSEQLPRALELLERQPIVRLSIQQVQQFTGRPAPNRAGSPYLVRAVYPTSRATVQVRWFQNDLYVQALGLGSGALEKRAVIVFLSQRPTEVFVLESAAM